jgi:uncharacterized protein
MKAPLFAFGVVSEGNGLVIALVLGFLFGWFLEQGGLGNARKLAGQFYLTDLTVFKVMFSAIVTAALGVFWLDRIGWLDASLIFVPPTYLVPQAVGGAVFGIGFVTGGLCPGTSCVAAATGRTDGIAVLLGITTGVLAFALVQPTIQPFYESTARGALTVDSVLHLGSARTVFLLVVIALGGFVGAEAIERRTRARA